ncbi:MAG: hypothetical protein LBJ67_18645 [Planctomycetaceae bacterium]|jgi:hypothetical protein|nr:hypothetical protein [Planctomycetaceae bacterium]
MLLEMVGILKWKVRRGNQKGSLYHLNQFQNNTGITGLDLNGVPTLGGTSINNTLNINILTVLEFSVL